MNAPKNTQANTYVCAVSLFQSFRGFDVFVSTFQVLVHAFSPQLLDLNAAILLAASPPPY